ncbi:MAG: hypothetical protein HKN35_08180 [Woeseia sp.]|nr:hypothetical protein [Woeseia sp.]MBT8096733.1 hypothetical protein [Woeseia sp.]NNE60855.1 hypothetical protein [Woeseia sp.]NNL54487.1 hypothetical protein [Woeseia sp.]
MKPLSREKVLSLPISSVRTSVLLLLLLAGAGLSVTALAASDTTINCDRLETSLRSLDVPVDELTNAEQDLAGAADVVTGTVPVLQLARRAKTLTRDVFAALPIVVLDEDGAELEANQSLSTEITDTLIELSPLVLAPAGPEQSNTDAEQDMASDNPQPIPRFQRHMYRTDI